MEEKQLWDRLEDETSKAYEAFLQYIMMSPSERTYPLLAERRGLKSLGSIEYWANKHNWAERTQAYDDHMAKMTLALRETKIEEYQQFVLSTAMEKAIAVGDVLDGAIKQQRDKLEAGEEINALDISRLVNSLRTLDDVQRRIAQMPTVYTRESTDDGIDEDTIFVIGGDNV